MTNLHLSTRYPGGFRLTMKTAKELARQEFGTAAGLMRDTDTDLEGYFKMILGHLVVTIRPDIRMSGCIEVRAGMHTANHSCVGYFDPATLEPRYDVMERYEQEENQDRLEQLVFGAGPEQCHKLIELLLKAQGIEPIKMSGG